MKLNRGKLRRMILNEIRNLDEADPGVKITTRNFTTGSVEGNALNQIENLKALRGQRKGKVYKKKVDKLIEYYKKKSIKDIFVKLHELILIPLILIEINPLKLQTSNGVDKKSICFFLA